MTYRQSINTIADLEALIYGDLYNKQYLQKADAPMLSSTSGIYNAIYGAKCWVNLNLEANAVGMFKKVPWSQSGWRLITARANSSVGGGVAENAALPETIKPTFEEVATNPKTIVHNFDSSEVMQFLGTVDDSLQDVMGVLREYMAKEHGEQLNKMLLVDASAAAAGASADRAAADKYDLESLDRIISSDSEEDAFGGTYDNWFDIFGLDRDATSTYDAYVSHNSGTDRSLSLSLIDSMFTNIWSNGGKPKAILTGYDTLMATQQLLQSQQRFMDSKRVTPGVNGIQGVEGINAGFIVATYNGVPIIPSKDTVQDTLSRMFFIDTDYMEMRIAKPTEYFESGILSGDPFGINRLGQEGMYRTMGEMTCQWLGAQGKLRDLS